MSVPPPPKVSVYEDDEEALSIWRDVVGVDPSHIKKMGAEDNFWASGATGVWVGRLAHNREGGCSVRIGLVKGCVLCWYLAGSTADNLVDAVVSVTVFSSSIQHIHKDLFTPSRSWSWSCLQVRVVPAVSCTMTSTLSVALDLTLHLRMTHGLLSFTTW